MKVFFIVKHKKLHDLVKLTSYDPFHEKNIKKQYFYVGLPESCYVCSDLLIQNQV